MKAHSMLIEMVAKKAGGNSQQILVSLYDAARAKYTGVETQLSIGAAAKPKMAVSSLTNEAKEITSVRAIDVAGGWFVELTRVAGDPEPFATVGKLFAIETPNGPQRNVHNW